MARIDREEIERDLQNIPVDVLITFAIRAVFRVLPLLMEKVPLDKTAFWYWDESQRSHHLLVLFTACNACLLKALDQEMLPTRFGSAHDAAYDAANNGAYAAYAAADAVAYASDAAYGHVNPIACVTDAIVAATDVAIDIDTANEIRCDMSLLGCNSAVTLLQLPLWSTRPPNKWEDLATCFERTLGEFGSGFRFWKDWFEARRASELIDIERLKRTVLLPRAILTEGVPQINAYLADLMDSMSTKSLNRVRVIFIGDGDAGKTSLIHALHNEPVAAAEEMTAGVVIREWAVPNSSIRAYFWDFGGQVMMHATHKMFFRDGCLYVLVVSARVSDMIGPTEQARYWLEHVKLFGKSAPVIIVGNKLDQMVLNIDISFLREKYPNIIDYFALSCAQARASYASHFNNFFAEFVDQLRKVGTHQLQFSIAQFKVLTSLGEQAQKSHFLTYREFERLCDSHDVVEGDHSRQSLVDILDKLGVIINFPRLSSMSDYILDPHWLTNGVCTLIYSQKYRLTFQDIVELLRKKQLIDKNQIALSYTEKQCLFISEVMQNFKLCYPLHGEVGTMIIPISLPACPPKYDFDKNKALSVEFSYKEFLPRHLFSELIVNHHKEIQNEIVWQQGVVIAKRGYPARALIQVDYHLRTIFLWVVGDYAREYLIILRDEIDNANEDLNLQVEELIVLPFDTWIRANSEPPLDCEEKASLRQIFAHNRRGIQSYISASDREYDVRGILKSIEPNPEHANRPVILNFDKIEVNNNVTVYGDTAGSVNVGSNICNSYNQLSILPVLDEKAEMEKNRTPCPNMDAAIFEMGNMRPK